MCLTLCLNFERLQNANMAFFLYAQDGNPDLSYFTLDCFHFSERAQAEMAISLWNNMVRHKRCTDLHAKGVLKWPLFILYNF